MAGRPKYLPHPRKRDDFVNALVEEFDLEEKDVEKNKAGFRLSGLKKICNQLDIEVDK